MVFACNYQYRIDVNVRERRVSNDIIHLSAAAVESRKRHVPIKHLLSSCLILSLNHIHCKFVTQCAA